MLTVSRNDLKDSLYTLNIVDEIINKDPDCTVVLSFDKPGDVDADGFFVVSKRLHHKDLNYSLEKYTTVELRESDMCPIPGIITNVNVLKDLDIYRLFTG